MTTFNYIQDIDTFLKDKDWKHIKDWSGYIITNTGDVISEGNKSNHNLPILLNQSPDKDGYLRVTLANNRYRKTKRVNILVAEHFLAAETDKNKNIVNHIDKNKQNNHCNNLEWVTNYENWKHSEEDQPKQEMKVCQMDLSGNVLNYYKSLMEASRQTGISQGNISNNIAGRCKSVGGYKWRLV